ncbi:MAG: translation initiation factor IF-2 [Alistipes sp.]|nr:translation initiation factor IF-2 [Alistipes sp.]
MANEKKLRLIQVAKEFKVGLNTITDFLQKKGIKSDGSPNTLVDGDTYAILEKEFGSNRAAAGARDSVRERISQKQTSISLDGAQPKAKEEKEVIIKSNMIHVKDEIQQPKFLGKIDLDAKNEPKKEEPKPVVEAPKVAEQPKVETPKVEEKPAEKPVEAPKVEKPVEVKKEEPKPVAEAPKVVEQPMEEAPKAEEKKDDNVFRPGGVTLQGPQVLGTMDVSGFVPGGKHKRKRLQKEKVDVTKAQKGQQGGGKNEQRGGGQQNQNRPGQQNQQQNQPKPGEGRRNKNKQKPQPKPVVRPEVSDEEVSKQVKDTLARLTAKGTKTKASKYRKEKREIIAERMNEEFEREVADRQTLKVTEFVTVSELATMMNVAPTEVIMACMNLGLMVSINQRLDAEALVVVAEEFGFKTEFVSVEIQEAIAEEVDTEENLVPRPPIVTVMGHVDHGKTSLLDNIRKTNVIAGEAGGITQHIGAYSVELNGQKITFLDTPGHEAFTAMRARGAKITDVAIIIVAADDSVMPQTIEAINHAQAAGVPMVFAINKIDKPQANPEHIKEQLSAMNYLVESWGGKYQDQEISAKKGLNLDKLLEKVLLEAEMLELKANPDKRASGSVIESTLDKGRGYVSTILVQSGTLRVGDVMLSGTFTGRVKAMFNENGKKVTEAGPSTPVQVLGLNGAPQAGDSFNVMEDDRSAREIANKREQLQRMQGIMTQKHVTLDEIGRRIAIGSFKELNIIVKGDVDGSVEAMSGSLIKLSKETVQVNVIHAAVGQISESDVLLAAASNAIIVGFQVRPSASARKLAEKEEIEIRLYSIIYDAINDIKDAIEGMLEPVMKEEIVASVEVLETFKISKVGTIAGGIVREGKIGRNTPIRVIRDGIVIYTGKLGSLKRFKDDVKEVTSGMDCGLNIESFNDIKVGDIIEGYEQVEVKRK